MNTLSTLSKEFIDKTRGYRFKNAKWDKSIQISITTLDNLIKSFGVPKFCKIDVEGSEFSVLLGLSTPVEYLSIEFVPEIKENSIKSIDLLCKLSKDYVFNYSKEETLEFELKDWMNKEDFINYINTIKLSPVTFGDIYAKLNRR